MVKVHESYRMVVAVCDADVFGRKLADEEEGRVLDISGVFFDGEVMSLLDAREEVARCAREDATFNFVGKRSVSLARELGLVKSEGIMEINGVPFALVLL